MDVKKRQGAQLSRSELDPTAATANALSTPARYQLDHGSEYRTPHLDRLAADGVRLEQHHVFPMCSPTRAALLTGRFASRFGCTTTTNSRVLPFDTVTVASALKSAGYETTLAGKWHLGSKPEWGANP